MPAPKRATSERPYVLRGLRGRRARRESTRARKCWRIGARRPGVQVIVKEADGTDLASRVLSERRRRAVACGCLPIATAPIAAVLGISCRTHGR